MHIYRSQRFINKLLSRCGRIREKHLLPLYSLVLLYHNIYFAFQSLNKFLIQYSITELIKYYMIL
jgi:hypothetical protein